MIGEHLAILDAVDGHGRGLRVAIAGRERCLTHRVGVVVDAAVQWVLASADAGACDALPPSPPWQQFAVVPLDGGQAILVLGMADRNHWSVSIESQPADRLIRFDVACRAHVTEPGWLRSTYQILGSCQSSAGVNGAKLELAANHGHVCVRAASAADYPTTVTVQGGQLVIGPARLAGSSTHRWRYDLVLTPP